MGKYKERKQKEVKSKSNKALGLVLILLGIVGFGFACFSNFVVGKYILGAFGICAFPLFLTIFLIGLAKYMGLVYRGDARYAFRICATILSVLCLIHAIFSITALNNSSFGEYLVRCLTLKNGVTIGGVVLGLMCKVVSVMIGGVGACIFWGISAVVFGGLTVDYAIYSKNQNAQTQKVTKVRFQDNYFDEMQDEETAQPEFLSTKINQYTPEEDEVAETPTQSEDDENSARSILFGGQARQNDDDANSFTENKSESNEFKSAKDILFGSNPVPNIYNSTDEERRAWLSANSTEETNASNGFDPVQSENSQRSASQMLFGTRPEQTTQSGPDRARAMDILGMNRQGERGNVGQMRGISTFNDDVLGESNSENRFNSNDPFNFNRNQNNNFSDENGNSTFGRNGASSNLNNSFDNSTFGINTDESEPLFGRGRADHSDFGRGSDSDELFSNRRATENFGRNAGTSDENILSDEQFANPFKRDNSIDENSGLTRGRGASRFETDLTVNQNNLFESSNDRTNKTAPRMEQTIIGQAVKPDKPIKRVVKDLRYNAPPISLLNESKDDPNKYAKNYEENARIIENKLETFRIPAKVVHVVRGPTVTQFELQMPAGIPVKKILNYDSDLAMALKSKAGIRIEAPIPGKDAVGIEIPNNPRSTVTFRELVESKEFSSSSAILPIAVGKSISGEVIVKSLAKFVHTLVAGSTGSGKSVFLHCVIMSLMFKMSPSQLRFIMIDPKRVEFSRYNGMPHMMLPNIVSNAEKAINSLSWAVKEMERRYEVFTEHKCANIEAFNQCSAVKNGEIKQLPYIVIIVDELAQLMEVSKREVEEKIRQLAALARAAGIHLVLATQRPSVDVITGTIKANLPTRIAFALSNHTDSQTILDEPGAEKLLGRGDMLFSPQDSNTSTRLQAAFITDEEIEKCIQYIKDNNDCDYDAEVEKEIYAEKQDTQSANMASTTSEERGDMTDELVPEAIKYFIESGKASISMLQRRFYVGFNRAGRIFDQIQKLGYIVPTDGAKKNWEIRLTMDEYNEIYGEN